MKKRRGKKRDYNLKNMVGTTDKIRLRKDEENEKNKPRFLLYSDFLASSSAFLR